MKRNVHAVAGVLAVLFIATFWTSTVIAELFFDHSSDLAPLSRTGKRLEIQAELGPS